MVLDDLRRRGQAPRADVGFQTSMFVRMFCRDPESVLARMDDAYVDGDAIFDDLPRITFLRQEALVEELEEPVRALKPGLERVGRVLDDPAVDTVPDTLNRIHDDLMPLIHGLRQAQERMGTMTGSVAGLLRRRARPEEDADPAD